MTSNDVFALAAHLHVLLRRKTGRVTDTEWLTTNADYAREIVLFTREKATSEEHADLLALADKLEAAIPLIAAPGRKPLLQAAADTLKAGQVSAAAAQRAATPRSGGFANSMPAGQSSGFIESTLISAFGGPRKDGEDPDARYVGGIR
ncbi:MAG: hypothetical protein U1E12_13315 [Hydrogenophaga sp.]|uniref:hypothetical protein n=1 Tax=Hydrogenophaga sp. TaxID=1904254 RepID=UPI002AB97312|nr:hypothetical protein [Hydrogenophaga sp.]MDZ4102645.1 hypothetical protein [Hydrogenophaga sp.]